MNHTGTIHTCPTLRPDQQNTGINYWPQVEYWSKLQFILDNSRDGFVHINLHREVVMCNQSFKKMARELTGNPLATGLDVLHFVKPGSKNIDHFIDDILAGESLEYDLPCRTQNQPAKWFHIHLYPSKNETGCTNGFCISLKDITGRKMNQDTLSYSVNLMDNMKDTVISTDLDFNIVSLNKAAEKMGQVTIGEVIGLRTTSVFDYIYVGSSEEEMISVLQRDDFWQGKIIFNRKDGNKIYLNSTITPVKDENNAMIGFLGVHTDISEKLHLEEMISRHQGYLHSVFEAVPESFFLLDHTNKIILFNEGAVRLMKKYLGLKIENGTSLLDIVPAARKEDVREKLAMARKGFSFDYEILYPCDTWLWVSMTPVKNKEGDISEVCVGLKDITNYKNLEFRLRKSEEQYRSLFDSMAEGVIYQSNDKAIITCNHSAEKILGIKKEMLEMEGFPLPGWNIVNERKEKINFKEDYAENMERCGHVREHIVGIKGKSKIQWLSLNIEPVYDDNSVIKGKVYSFSDISKRRKMNKELKVLFMAAMKVNNSVVITNSKKKIVWANRAFIHNTGYEFEEVKGKVPGELLQGPDTDPQTVKFMREALRNGVPFECEVQNYKKSGEKFWMRIQVQPLYGHNGSISGYLGVGANITEQKRLQEKLIRQKVERQKEITRATISGQEKERNELGRELHDNINQILAATKMQLEVHLRSEKGRPECIRSSHEYLNLAMKEIRCLSKRLVSPRFQENNLLDEIEIVVGNLGLARKTKLDASKFLEDEVPEEVKLTIFRIVQEQLNNIVKYAKARSVKISLEVNKKGIDLIIHDDGVGFDTTLKRNGIGLSNIQTRAELYSGSAKIISVPGKGCCLEVFLPFKKEEE